MKRPLSPSALNATAARTDLAVDHSCDDAIVVSVASPAGAARPARHGGGGDSSSKPTATAATTIAAVDDGPPAKLRHRTKSVVCMLLLVVGITASFIAWHLTIGRGPQRPNFLFHQQCNNSSSKDGCCNGLGELCDLPVNEVLFATVHNAHSSREDFFLRPNHRFGLGRALEYGYRALLLDVCSCPPMGLVFCHSVCGAGTVSTEKVFGSIRQFLLGNPNEVLLLEYQMHSIEAKWLFALRDVIVDSGLSDLIHVHRGSFFDDWATMRELIETNERLIMFQHNGPYCWPPPVCPEMLHTFHWYAVETAHSVRGVNNLLSYNQSCKIVAGWNATMKFVLLNHFAGSALGLPKLRNAERLNERSVLEERIAACTNYLGMRPNLIAVDFWDIGDLPAVVQEQNRMRAQEIVAQRNNDDDDDDDDDNDTIWGH